MSTLEEAKQVCVDVEAKRNLKDWEWIFENGSYRQIAYCYDNSKIDITEMTKDEVQKYRKNYRNKARAKSKNTKGEHFELNPKKRVREVYDNEKGEYRLYGSEGSLLQDVDITDMTEEEVERERHRISSKKKLENRTDEDRKKNALKQRRYRWKDKEEYKLPGKPRKW